MIHGIDTSFLVATELASHSRHADSRQLLKQLSRASDQFALAPQVLAEFAHVVTDSRRCANPLDMAAAVERAELLWNVTQTVQVFPDTAATSQFLTWMRLFRLGRKRLLDTLLAATFHVAAIQSVITLNRSDFELFVCFSVHKW